jgi:PAS domain S-box-containing protein
MIIPPDRLYEEAEILARIRRGESIDHFETVRRRKDGTLLDISLTVSPILDSQDQIIGVSKIARDITERRRMEDALRKSQEELTDFIEAATLGVHRVGPDGIIQWANRAELQMLGYEVDEYFGRHISDFHADKTVIQDIIQRLAHGETIHDSEAVLRAKDGSLRHVRIDSTGFWENGEFKYTRCFTRDETERKRAEEDIRRLNQDLQRLVNELQTVLDVSPMGIGVAEDPECRVVRVNPAFAGMVGISPEVNASKTAVPEQPLPFKVFKNGRELRGEELPMQVAAARGILVAGEELELQREDGRVVNVLMHAAPLLSSQPEVT